MNVLCDWLSVTPDFLINGRRQGHQVCAEVRKARLVALYRQIGLKLWTVVLDDYTSVSGSMQSWCTELLLEDFNSNFDWHINQGTGEGLGETLLRRRLEWRLLTWNVYYSNHSENKKSYATLHKDDPRSHNVVRSPWQGLSGLPLPTYGFIKDDKFLHVYLSLLSLSEFNKCADSEDSN